MAVLVVMCMKDDRFLHDFLNAASVPHFIWDRYQEKICHNSQSILTLAWRTSLGNRRNHWIHWWLIRSRGMVPVSLRLGGMRVTGTTGHLGISWRVPVMCPQVPPGIRARIGTDTRAQVQITGPDLSPQVMITDLILCIALIPMGMGCWSSISTSLIPMRMRCRSSYPGVPPIPMRMRCRSSYPGVHPTPMRMRCRSSYPGVPPIPMRMRCRSS